MIEKYHVDPNVRDWHGQTPYDVIRLRKEIHDRNQSWENEEDKDIREYWKYEPEEGLEEYLGKQMKVKLKEMVEKNKLSDEYNNSIHIVLENALMLDLNKVKTIIEQKRKDINKTNKRGLTPLLAFINHHHGTIHHSSTSKEDMNKLVKVLELLLKNGADPTKCDKKGDNAVHFCTSKGFVEALSILTKHPKWLQMREKMNDRHESPLYTDPYHKSQRSWDAHYFLLKNGATILNNQYTHGKLMLEATRDGQDQFLALMLDKVGDNNVLVYGGGGRIGSRDNLINFVEKPSTFEVLRKHGKWKGSNTNIIPRLIQEAVKNSRKNGSAGLINALSNGGKKEIVKFYLDNGFPVDFKWGETTAIQELLERMTDYRKRHKALYNQSLEVLDVFLANKPNLSIKSKVGDPRKNVYQTPLEFARAHGLQEVVQRLTSIS